MQGSGHYKGGCGKAHLADSVHMPFFGCPMFGTFNVRTQMNIESFKPSLVPPGNSHRYWRIRIDDEYDAWAWRRPGSRMPGTIWELISKERLPERLKHKTLKLEIVEAP